MTMFKYISVILVSSVGLFLFQPVYAISVDELNQKINSGEALTVIDARINLLYQKSHIHNAINIPASIIARKRLPPLGRVFVYGDGIDEQEIEKAIEQLNLKAGITAEALEGGYLAWSASKTVIQRKMGLDTTSVKNISYKKLKDMSLQKRSLLLIDLRIGERQELLPTHFPNVNIHDPITKLPEKVSAELINSILSGIPKSNQNILILIDDGDGLSEKIAAKLHAAGTKRLAILAGGEQTLRVRGEISEVIRKSGE